MRDHRHPYDSTSNNNSGTQNGNDDASGQIVNGQIFDGNAAAPDYVNVPSPQLSSILAPDRYLQSQPG